jgi:hypothetical protein
MNETYFEWAVREVERLSAIRGDEAPWKDLGDAYAETIVRDANLIFTFSLVPR